MILLLGPQTWVARVGRILTDRTMDVHGSKVKIAYRVEQLRGTNEHIEIVACTGLYELTIEDERAIQLAEHINATL